MSKRTSSVAKEKCKNKLEMEKTEMGLWNGHMKLGSFLVILKKRSEFPSSYLRKQFVHLSFSIKVKLKSRNSIDKCYVLMTGGEGRVVAVVEFSFTKVAIN